MINNIITLVVIFFDVEWQEILTSSTKCKWYKMEKYVYFLPFWKPSYMTTQMLSFSW